MSEPVRQAQVGRLVKAGWATATAVEQALDCGDPEAEQRAAQAMAVWLRACEDSSPAEFDQAWEHLVGPASPVKRTDRKANN
jgi:hypothetical protein